MKLTVKIYIVDRVVMVAVDINQGRSLALINVAISKKSNEVLVPF